LFTTGLPGLLTDPSLPLYSRDVYYNAVPTSLPHILVLQGTLDPKTPLEGAVAHIAQWHSAKQVKLVSVSGSPHFVLMTSPTCFKDAVSDFLTDKHGALPSCMHPDFRANF
jgi:pimeloyl-ACP methyl ester carboxylesterase